MKIRGVESQFALHYSYIEEMSVEMCAGIHDAGLVVIRIDVILVTLDPDPRFLISATYGWEEHE